MPELPEVETIKRGLEPLIVGRRIMRIDQRRPDLRFPFPKNFSSRLAGALVTALDRRAKYLVATLETGESLIIHLGMSGRIAVTRDHKTDAATLGEYVYDAARNPKHDHVVFALSGGTTLTYNDPRRFGFMELAATEDLDQHRLFKHLGVEPISNHLSAQYLAGRAQGRAANLKSFLMDQRHIAGLGNIYVCEALHLAGLSPNRRAKTLASKNGAPLQRTEVLVRAIRSVLEKAVRYGGSTLRDYRAPSGKKGGFQEAFTVYNRAGQACVRKGCGGTVRRVVHQGRSTFYCPRCQR